MDPSSLSPLIGRVDKGQLDISIGSIFLRMANPKYSLHTVVLCLINFVICHENFKKQARASCSGSHKPPFRKVLLL